MDDAPRRVIVPGAKTEIAMGDVRALGCLVVCLHCHTIAVSPAPSYPLTLHRPQDQPLPKGWTWCATTWRDTTAPGVPDCLHPVCQTCRHYYETERDRYLERAARARDLRVK